MTTATTKEPSWWGARSLPVGGSGTWRIGPLKLCAQRTVREWFRSHERVAEDRDATLEITVPTAEAFDLGSGEHVRFAFESAPENIRMTPALADRPVVVSALTAFKIPAGEAVILFVGSAVWIDVAIGDSDTLLETPTVRPSDTWFGPDTRTGELCYASQTRARTALDGTPDLPHRVVSVVRIHNRASSALPIERIKIPMPSLSLYATPDGRLWTEGMTLERVTNDELAEIRLSGRPPAEAKNGVELAGPRRRTERGLVHAFGRLFDV